MAGEGTRAEVFIVLGLGLNGRQYMGLVARVDSRHREQLPHSMEAYRWVANTLVLNLWVLTPMGQGCGTTLSQGSHIRYPTHQMFTL